MTRAGEEAMNKITQTEFMDRWNCVHELATILNRDGYPISAQMEIAVTLACRLLVKTAGPDEQRLQEGIQIVQGMIKERAEIIFTAWKKEKKQ